MAIIALLKDRFTKKRDLRTRLWRGGGMIFVFMFTMFVGNFFLGKDRAVTWDMLGHDFLAFYYGGTCARTGHFEQLYDLPVTRAFEFKTGHAAGLSMGTSFGPWWNPPFAAWMFAPLSALPYLKALHVWWTIGGISLAISIFLMCRMLQGGWKTQLLVPLLVVSTMPCFQAFCHGQNTFVSLLLLTVTISLWRADQSVLAGLICGLLFYKPQLGAIVALVLVLCQGRRALLGVAFTGTALVLVNMLTMPGSMKEFVFHMPQNMHWIQEQMVYRWERHITFKAFWRMAIQGWVIGPPSRSVELMWAICEAGVLAGLMMLVFKTRNMPDLASRRDRLISASIIAMPLLMPFYFDYDLLLLSVGIVAFAADRQRDPGVGNWEDRWLVRVFVTVYIALEFTMILYHSRVHPVVPLLTAATVLLIRRGIRPPAQAAEMHLPESFPVAMAA
jgi:Glycosyltransferase family 87